eukprot:TRINITY_DN20144_c0_g1_i1.p1 TRINITY_DN20144_c0_g1~~TRINITY_DN20144_c0_g1_i1.p1  ORF type:complete len:296 (+),score=26.64 TRINITY_DN20144_c0_g1_i1:39-926(+)
MKVNRVSLFKATTSIRGGPDLNNPYCAFARNGPPSSTPGGHWLASHDIRHEADGTWAPVRPDGNPTPTMGQFLVNLNPNYPVIEPLYHPKLTHEQKMTRLYKRALRELLGKVRTVNDELDVISFYMRQVRAEFEKNREVDRGTAEWLFHRAVNYIESKKTKITFGFAGEMPGHVSWGRYHNAGHPDEFHIFPHGFDPEEAYKLMNPYHKFGIPYMGRKAAFITPHQYMMNPIRIYRNQTGEVYADALGKIISASLIISMIIWAMGGGLLSSSADNYEGQSDYSLKGEIHRTHPAV